MAMPKIVSIDQSLSGTGVCVVDSDRPSQPVHLETVKTDSSKPVIDRIVEIVSRIETVVQAHAPTIITVEEPTRMAQSAALIPLVELFGSIRYRLRLMGWLDGGTRYDEKTVRTQNQSTMKKFSLGDGSKSKDSGYLLAVYQATGIQFKDDNQADAYQHAITATAGYRISYGLSPVSDYTPIQLSALARVPDAKIRKMAPELVRKIISSGVRA
jgi:Holliday junction resolvasome RuvABC endonuclease subunit